MKRFALLSACLAVLSASTGCCCFPFCGGGYGGCGYQPAPACSPCAPYGAGYAPYGAMTAPTSAGLSAGLAIGPAYAAVPYPVMAAAPIDVLPTY
jgi:hypothetical protein